jgi:hypothetical protein
MFHFAIVLRRQHRVKGVLLSMIPTIEQNLQDILLWGTQVI